jgi:hypothetical protein
MVVGQKSQGADWKLTNTWMARDNSISLFRNKTKDHLFWTICAAVPVLSAYETLTM